MNGPYMACVGFSHVRTLVNQMFGETTEKAWHSSQNLTCPTAHAAVCHCCRSDRKLNLLLVPWPGQLDQNWPGSSIQWIHLQAVKLRSLHCL